MGRKEEIEREALIYQMVRTSSIIPGHLIRRYIRKHKHCLGCELEYEGNYPLCCCEFEKVINMIKKAQKPGMEERPAEVVEENGKLTMKEQLAKAATEGMLENGLIVGAGACDTFAGRTISKIDNQITIGGCAANQNPTLALPSDLIKPAAINSKEQQSKIFLKDDPSWVKEVLEPEVKKDPDLKAYLMSDMQEFISSESWLKIKPLDIVVAYVSGPMTGYPEHNFPAFREATKVLREEGFCVLDPSENDSGSADKSWEWYMRIDIANVCKADKVFVLPGWRKSKGATLEVMVAERLGIPVIDFHTREVVDEHILEEAMRLVSGDRQASYSHPIYDFTKTALKWTGSLLDKLKPGVFIQPEDVANMMIDLKVSRQSFKYKRDNLVDIGGYATTADMVNTARENGEMKEWLDRIK